MCLYSRLAPNKKYTATKKNGGVIPIMKDKRVKYVAIGCGKCMECRKKYRREWQVRLQEEVRHEPNGKFVTFTISNEELAELNKEIPKEAKGYDRDNAIATLAIRRFLERWRKRYGQSLRHWFVTELGHQGTENIHIHGVIWDKEWVEGVENVYEKTLMHEVERIWGYGWVWKGKKHWNGQLENYVNERTINYIVKYVHKVDYLHKEYKPKVLCSAGIGAKYFERSDAKRHKYKGEETRTYYVSRTGHKMSLPSYYRRKLWTEEESEKLWLHLLDKEIRFVDGIEISIKENEIRYYQALKTAREKNQRLGYGNDEINWNRREYETKRRELKLEERIGEILKQEEDIHKIPKRKGYEDWLDKKIGKYNIERMEEELGIYFGEGKGDPSGTGLCPRPGEAFALDDTRFAEQYEHWERNEEEGIQPNYNW